MRTKRIAAWILTGVLTLSAVGGSGVTAYAATEDMLLTEPESNLLSEETDGILDETIEGNISDDIEPDMLDGYPPYNSDWRSWITRNSTNEQMRDGCRLIAYTKILAVCGFIDPATYNPDNFYDWCLANGQIVSASKIDEKGSKGDPLVTFVNQQQGSISRQEVQLTGSMDEKLSTIMTYVNAGAQVVLYSSDPPHAAYVDSEVSKQKGTPWVSDSSFWGSATGWENNWDLNASRAHFEKYTNFLAFYINGSGNPTPVPPTDESATVTVLLNENEKTAITYSSLEEATASFENDFKDQRYTEYSKVTFAFNGNVKLNSDISFPKGFPYVIFEPAKSETIDGTVYYDHTLLDFNGHKIEHFPTHPLTIKGISCISSTDDDHPGLIRGHGIDYFVENTTIENAQITVLRNVNLEEMDPRYSLQFICLEPASIGKTYIVDSKISGYSVCYSGVNCTWNLDRLINCSLHGTGDSRYPNQKAVINAKELIISEDDLVTFYNGEVVNIDNIIIDGGELNVSGNKEKSILNVKDTIKVIKEYPSNGLATIYNYGYLYVNKLDMPRGLFLSGGFTDINEAINLYRFENTSSSSPMLDNIQNEGHYPGWARFGAIRNMDKDGGICIDCYGITQIDESAVISNIYLGQDVFRNNQFTYLDYGPPAISRLSDTKIDITGEFYVDERVQDNEKLYVQTVTRSEDPNKKGSYIYSDPVTTSGTVFTTNMKNFPVDKIAVIQPAKTDGVYQDGNKIIVGKKGQKPVVVKVASVKINETNPELAVGQTTKLTYSYEPVDATNADATWKSANTKVATIDPKTGEVTGISPGTSKITVTAGERSASTTVTVVDRKVALTGLTVDGSVSLNLYENKQLNIVKTPEDATDKITCTSSDPSVVSVNDNGIMTGLKAGAALVTVRGGDLEEQCIVTVKAAITQLKLDKTDVVLTTGQKTSLTAQASPEGIECSYIWSVSVAQISENRIPDEFIRISPDKNRAEITALKPCDAEVTVSAADNEGNTRSTVARIAVKASDLTNSEDVTLSGNETEKIIEALEEDAAENDGRQGLWISGLKSEYEYNGMPVEPEVTVYHGTTRLQPGKDYSIAYADNKKPYATGTIKVTGKGSYSGKTTQTFKIVDNVSAGNNSLKKASVTGLAKSYDFTGNRITPDIEVALNGSVLTKDVDYTLSFSKNVNAGTARLVIEGIGGYKDNIKKTFKINAVNMADPGIKINAGQAVYMAGGAVPIYSVTYTAKDGTVWTLREGIDYKTRITQNKLAGGKGILTVIGQGNFVKKAAVDFDVTAGDLSDLIMSVADLNYKSGQKKSSAYQAKVKIIDKDGKNLSSKDYSLAYKDVTTGIVLDANTSKEDLGKVKQGDMIMVTAAGAGGKNYSGELVGFYKLVSDKEIKDINKAGAVVVRSPEYDGGEKTPGVTLTWGKEKAPLTEGTDYKIVSYYNNVRKGTAYAIVQGMGSFSGTKTVKFTINASDVDRNYLGAWNSKDLKFVR